MFLASTVHCGRLFQPMKKHCEKANVLMSHLVVGCLVMTLHSSGVMKLSLLMSPIMFRILYT